MKTTAEFLGEIKTRFDLPSDGRLAAKLGLTRSSISRLMAGRDFMGDDTAMTVAELLDLDPAYVVACSHAERAARAHNTAAVSLWERIASNMSHAAAAAVLGVCVLLGSAALPSAISPVSEASAGSLYIMSNPWLLLIAFAALAVIAFPHKRPPCDLHK